MTDDALAVPPELAALADYTDLRPLGQGGMGLVFAGTHALMGRPVVLKLLAPAVAGDDAAAERFQREVRAAATLDHPNVVKAYAAHRAGGRLVLVMEFVPGDDLAKVVQDRGALTPTHACYYAYQAALGLQHAHERGMVHRDIKPGNLLLARVNGRSVVKVADFGLAKAAREEEDRRLGLTRTGQLMGSPHYFAPEQALDAHAADIRSDVYSLGCTLYHLLAGRPPFDGPSLIALVDAHRAGGARPLNEVRPDVTAELAAVVGKMMARWPAQRFPTPAAAATALKPFFKPGDGSTEATPVRPLPATAGPPTPRAEPVARHWQPPTVFRGTAVPTDTAHLNPEDFTPVAKPKPPKTRRPKKPAVPVFGLVVAGSAAAAVAVLVGLVAVAVQRPAPAPEVAVVTPVEPEPTPKADPLPKADPPVPFDPAPVEKPAPKAKTGRAIDQAPTPKAPAPAKPAAGALLPAEAARRRATADNRKAFTGDGKDLMKREGKELVLKRTDAKQGWPLVGDPDWTDYDVTVRVKGAYGPCIIVRANYSAGDGDDAHLVAGMYTAGWSGDRLVSLAGYKNGNYLRAEQSDIRSVLGANVWRLMGVAVRGDTVESYLDGVRMHRGKPAMPARGMVGLRVADIGTVRFAELIVRDPDGTVRFEGLPEVPR